MNREKFDVLEKLHKDKIKKMTQNGEIKKEECEKYIKEMQEMELKRELKYNTAITVIIGAFLTVFLVLGISSISYSRHANKVKVAEKQKQEQNLAIKNEKNQDKKEVEKDKNNAAASKNEKPKVKEVKQDEKPYYEKIGSSLDKEEDRKNILKSALSLTGGKYEGINIKYMVSILKANGVNIPTSISRTDTLVKELEKLGWKKNTNSSDLKKGDIVFTTDTVGITGVPSHTYIFMGWENSKKENAYVVDALSAKENVTYHKRPITVQSETTDKMQFFMRK
ncbi:hypothetical protein [Haloimpatiens massiliensis]|uniref:hypothetical protein n=1 Tax=Haloimpatiens massiliensis TaxID=1658110 RepID=UPI000C857C91|nr:hypothetical protein [Haloimpatiens massiliensis]